MILKYNPNVRIENKFGGNALFNAIRGNVVEVVQLLLNHGYNINSVCSKNGFKPIHVAAMRAHLDIARTFLKNGTDVNALEFRGYTPLMIMLERNRMPHKDEGRLDFLLKYSDLNVEGPMNVVHLCWN